MRISVLMFVVMVAWLGGDSVREASADSRYERSRNDRYDRYDGYDDDDVDEARCVSGYGRTACGYSCTAAYGVVRCAATPAGRCEAAYGKVTCWDPPRWVFARYRGRPPQAQCVSAYGDIACGYGCEAAYGEVACASSPGGRCVAAYGELVCSR